MVEQIINLPTAILANEKGFQWPCRYFWDEDADGIFTYDTAMNWNGLPEDEYNGARYNAPTQPTLQKWLRDTHGFHPHICYIEENEWHVDIYKWKEENGLYSLPNHYKNYDTYEEALEVGLILMLNLIQ